MALTLEDLGFEFDDSALSSIDEEIQNGIIKPSTTIVDTPVLINNFLKKLADDLKTLFQNNLKNLAADFDSWFTQKAEDLKTEIENTLSLDPNTLYNIYVTKAQNAEDSEKFNGKTYSEVISDIYTNYISTATVTNALKFNGKTMNEYNDYIKNTLKPHASDTDKAYGYTYDELKSSILANVSTSGGGVDLDTVKYKVENEWTAYKASDSIKFNGDDADTWKNTIIPQIKVNNAVNADQINGVNYDTLITSIDNMIINHIEATISSNNEDLINIIKTTKVNNAVQADTADNALKFNGDDADTWKNTIIPAIKVDNASYADNAGKLGGLTSDEWQSKLDNLEANIESNVKNTWIAYKANDVLNINGIPVENFDDHITDLIESQINNINNLVIDADKFGGNTPEEWQTNIIPNIKVNNAVQADKADDATHASKADKAYLWCDSSTNECYTQSQYLSYIKNNFSSIINYLDYDFSNTFPLLDPLYNMYFHYTYFQLIPDKQIIFKEQNNLLNSVDFNSFFIDSYVKNYSKKIYTYDDNENLTQIDYYFKYKLYDEDDPSADPTIEERLIKTDTFEYDDSNNLTTITELYYFNIYQGTSIDETSINDDSNWLELQFFKTTDFTYDDNGNITEENYSYKIKHKLASEDDDSWVEEELI